MTHKTDYFLNDALPCPPPARRPAGAREPCPRRTRREGAPPSTKRKDRRTQPALYAEAGIRHYWRVETDQTAPAFAVYTYELDDATGAYVASGVHHDRIALAVPFDLDIELKAVRER